MSDQMFHRDHLFISKSLSHFVSKSHHHDVTPLLRYSVTYDPVTVIFPSPGSVILPIMAAETSPAL